MKAWLCAGLAATASGFGSVPGGGAGADLQPLCGDDDIKLATDSEGAVASCAAGLAEHNGVCSDDMYVEYNAPSGWFQATCPASCGACVLPSPSPSPSP